MSIMITSDLSKEIFREEDAVEGFREAVENGQVRLALQILVDVVDGMMEIFNMALGEEEENESQEQPSIEAPKNAEPIEEAVQVEEKKAPAKKAPVVKEETKAESESLA
jgi:hypothetical protein